MTIVEVLKADKIERINGRMSYRSVGSTFDVETIHLDCLPRSQCIFVWYRNEDGIVVMTHDPDEWLCICGNFIDSGDCHCIQCGGEAPWGCMCGDYRDEPYDGFFW